LREAFHGVVAAIVYSPFMTGNRRDLPTIDGIVESGKPLHRNS
jgi:hypothetical protein